MTDRVLRDHERRWHDTGSDEDAAQLLAQRVRAGLLPPARLELAACLGHYPAVIAADLRPEVIPDLAALLERSGRQVCVTAGLALAASALSAWTAIFPHDHRPQDVLAAIRAYVADPSAEREDRLTDLVLTASSALFGAVQEPLGGPPNTASWQAAVAAVALATGTGRTHRAAA